MTQFLKRSAFILLATSALGACTTVEPNFPIARGGQQAAPPPAPVPSEPVAPEQAPLPPPAASVVESRALEPPPPAPDYAPPPAAYTPAPTYAPPPPPVFRTVTKRTVTGKVVEVEGPQRTYDIKSGDNLERVAKKMDTTVEQLAKDNKLKAPYVVHPGDTLKGPRTKAKAYVVGSGDTVFSIARRFSVTAEALRNENDLGRNASIRSGQKLRLPGGYRDKGPVTTTTRVQVAAPPAPPPPMPVAPPPRPTYAPPPATTTTTTVTTTTPPAPAPATRPTTASPPAPRPYTPPPASTTTTVTTTTRPAPPAVPVSAPPASDAQISQLGRGRFVWPVRGDVISGFGPKATGQRNDGLNIRAATGDAVRAAASGDVVYAGDQVPGFGNLVLIKHAEGWVTAYGHLSRVDVKMQQKVTQGQQIGQAGSTGGAAEPQLHFEVRYAPSPLERARPVDPSLVLPR